MGRKIRWVILGLAVLLAASAPLFMRLEPTLWGVHRAIPEQEAALRQRVVDTAQQWYGLQEADDSHHKIIDIYNSHKPLARGYPVQYTDEWCAAFGSAVAIASELTDIIPTECGCERQIELFMERSAWQEDDGYIPLPGDYIFYHWGCLPFRACTHWSDHVGIVVGTWNGWIKVIEGNKSDAVGYRWLLVNDARIRGYGTPDYAGAAG